MDSAALPVSTRTFSAGVLPVEVYPTNEAMGRAAAAAVATAIQQLADSQPTVRIILGSANSQISFITALTRDHKLPWDRIVCFHMDEYIGIKAEHSASFRRWMQQRVVETVHPRQFHYLAGDAPDPVAEAKRYTELLQEQPIDITCLGFGENGHLAFNDPPFADFADPQSVKIIELDLKSRLQQVGEKHFPNLGAVPTHALTLTIPLLISAKYIFGIVPEKRKAAAVRAALQGPVTPDCPASILQRTANARLFLDEDAASDLSRVDLGTTPPPAP